jgi:lambda repressor-like predicted transcriptional regulator
MESKNLTWLEKYETYGGDCTDAPDDFHHFIGLSMLSAALGNKVFLRQGITNIYPNLWLVIIAPSSLYRKSTCLSIGHGVLNKSNCGNVYSTEFSHEKILEEIAERPDGIFIYYEFVTFMKMLTRDYMAGTKSMLTELYDCPEYYIRKTLGKSCTIKRPVISILGATTIQWFLDQIKEQDIEGGFLPRFVFYPSTDKLRTVALQPAIETTYTQEIAEGLKSLVKSILLNKDNEKRIVISEEAKLKYEGWYGGFEKRDNSDNQRYKSFMRRYGVILLKLSILHQILIDPKQDEISLEAMDLAIKDIKILEYKIKLLCEGEMAFTKEDKIKLKIKKIIDSNKEKGISQSDLGRQSGLLSHQLRSVLESLKDEQYINDEMLDTGADKKARIWKSIKD